MNLVVEKGGIAVLTDSQIASLVNVNLGKGAVLVAVPDSTSAAERVRIAKEDLA